MSKEMPVPSIFSGESTPPASIPITPAAAPTPRRPPVVTNPGAKLVKYSKTKAHTRYKTAAGVPIPGVTTVNNQLGWNKGALIAWARNTALAGLDPDKVKDEAADIGSLAHFMIECYLKGTRADTADFTENQIAKAENCFLAFLEWNKNYQFKCIESEIPLISEKYFYGGTIDYVATPTIGPDAGKVFLLDFKSSKGIYAEAFIQVAAYCHLWKQNRPQKIECVRILKLGKEDGSFEDHRVLPEKLTMGWEIFQHCRALYDLQKKFK